MQRKHLTLLNVIASFAVVMLHVNYVYWDFSQERYWIISNVIESVFFFAVPIFFMLSGVNLLDYSKKYSNKQYFIKRMDKTVVPFFVWTAIGSMYLAFFNQDIDFTIFQLLVILGFILMVILIKYLLNFYAQEKLICFILGTILIALLSGFVVSSSSPRVLAVKEIIEMFMYTKIVNIYWYFIPLFAIYLCIPILEQIQFESRENFFKWALIGTLILSKAIPLSFKVFFDIDYSDRLLLPLINGPLWYVIAGYYIKQYGIEEKYKKWIYFFGVTSLLVIIFGTQWESLRIGEISYLFKGEYNLTTTIYSVSIFVFILSIPINVMSKIEKIIDFIAPHTFGIYLIHWMVIPRVENFFGFNPYSIVFRTLGSVIVFILSLATVIIIKQIPLIKKILP